MLSLESKKIAINPVFFAMNKKNKESRLKINSTPFAEFFSSAPCKFLWYYANKDEKITEPYHEKTGL